MYSKVQQFRLMHYLKCVIELIKCSQSKCTTALAFYFAATKTMVSAQRGMQITFLYIVMNRFQYFYLDFKHLIAGTLSPTVLYLSVHLLPLEVIFDSSPDVSILVIVLLFCYQTQTGKKYILLSKKQNFT